MDYERLTPMMKQYFEIKNNYTDHILFYRLGDFYEMFFDDAVTASRELELTLTGRNAGLEEKAPLCGVPYHAAENYIAKLIDKGYKVAICEQTEDPSKANGLVKREVVKIMTPGTITNPGLLDDQSNNYLMSIAIENDNVAIVFGDISTFEIYAKTFKDSSTRYDQVVSEILKVNPREILILDDEIGSLLKKRLKPNNTYFTTLTNRYYKRDRSIQRIREVFQSPSLVALGFDQNSTIVPALGALIEYILETQKIQLDNFGKLEIERDDKLLMLDQSTISNLELTRTLRNHDHKGSLVWILDHTKTAMGSRMLKKWIVSPLRGHAQIVKRLNSVNGLKDQIMLRDDLFNSLTGFYDLERLVSKLIYGQILPRDLNAIRQSLEKIPQIINTLNLFKVEELNELASKLDNCLDIKDLIARTIVDEPPALMKDGGYIRNDYNEDIKELKDILTNGKQLILGIENREKEDTGIKNLKIKYNKVFGYYLDVTNSNLQMVPDRYIRKQTLANSERYITEELKILESKILSASEKSLKLEAEIFTQLREQLKKESSRLLKNASLISQIDVLASLGYVAMKNNYIRPDFNDEGVIDINCGRHPVVEKIVGDNQFISNEAMLDAQNNQFYIITGPNMAGKSTYLRQVALIAIMAQMGSFVPAKSANLMLFDRIFTRVGASDDLTQGQSTFMVEMSELASILRYATDDSLVLLDEIGRGTSTYDGLSIAWAVVEYLTNPQHSNPRTLFATHYHELTELEGKIDGVRNYNITVEENGEDIIFLRKIEVGSANQSYGIQVARLAGVPDKVIYNAKRILKELENTDIAKVPKLPEDFYQVTFFKEQQENEILQTLESVDINKMTPLDALNTLSLLKNILKNGVNSHE
jgi:DNA mismatch repair protein MutS